MIFRKIWQAGFAAAAIALPLSLFPNDFRPPSEVPMSEKPPVIDGKLDDPAWRTAVRMDGFKTWQPDYGKEPAQKTEAYFLYDAENFYLGFHCYDAEPGKIKASISKRDAMYSDDYAGFLLDTFNTKQESFAFMVNPLGIQGDGTINADGNLQTSLDLVWYSKGQIDENGYTVECRIPLQSIRFPNKKTVTMSLFFFRQIVRYSQMASSPAFYPDKGSVLAQGREIRVTGLRYKRVVEILPAVTHADHYAAREGRLRGDRRLTDFSLTAKVGLTSDLTSDAAYNPDFSQVESDAGQIDFNQRYALYYAEKRPFFLEGNDYFQFAGNTEDAPLGAVVYTRTIIDPVAGFKLSGKLGTKNTIAAVYARDDRPEDPVDVHPDFAILRCKRALKDDSYIGGFLTDKEQGNGYNRVAGSDGRVRLSRTSIAEYHAFGSFTRADGADSTADGHALGLRYNHQTRKVYLDIGYQDISKDFRVDSGFVTRTGLRNLALFAMYSIYPKSKFFQRIEPLYWSTQLYDTEYKTFETFNLFTLRFRLPRSSMFRLDAIAADEGYLGRKFNRNAFGVQGFTQLTKRLYLEGRFRRGGMIYYDPDAAYQGYGNRASVFAEYQPGEKLDFSLSVEYVDFYRKSDRRRIYDYVIYRSRNTFQVNKYLFLRAIVEYNTFRDRLALDTLASFTYIPGTVVYLGYGSAYEKLEWTGAEYMTSKSFLETQRGFFFKVSYLWRW